MKFAHAPPKPNGTTPRLPGETGCGHRVLPSRCRRWHFYERGVMERDDLSTLLPTRKGKKWRAQTVIHLAQSPSWAGLIPSRERQTDEFGNPVDKWHRGGAPLMGSDGYPIEAGQGVVTFTEWERIRAIISSRSRPGTTIGDRTRGARKAATIATGVLRCPYCTGPMGNGGRNYRCLARINQGKSVCQGVATMRDRADEALEILWTGHIESLPTGSTALLSIVRRWLSYRNPAKEASKRSVGAALDHAMSRELKLKEEFFIGGEMDPVPYEALRSGLAAQIADLKAEFATLSEEVGISPRTEAKDLMGLWVQEGVEGRRALLQGALKSVTVKPPKGRGDKTAILERLIPVWWDKPGDPADRGPEPRSSALPCPTEAVPGPRTLDT